MTQESGGAAPRERAEVAFFPAAHERTRAGNTHTQKSVERWRLYKSLDLFLLAIHL
jgi:hypothetical protein